MGQTSSVLSYESGKPPPRSHLVGLYVLASIEVLLALGNIGDGLMHGADAGSNYRTPTDKPVMIVLMVAGGVLFLAALSAFFWRRLRWAVLLVLQLAAALSQLPAILEARLELAEIQSQGGDWAGLAALGPLLTIVLLGVCAIVSILVIGYLFLPAARRAVSRHH